jgi:pimeloyl-ACP methyl ester carboxylesterase
MKKQIFGVIVSGTINDKLGPKRLLIASVVSSMLTGLMVKMRISSKISLLLFSMTTVAGCHALKVDSHQEQIHKSLGLPVTMPLDLAQLSKPPAVKWIDCNAGVWSLTYPGLPYKDKAKTSVFAYYATPGTLAGNKTSDKNLPAIVLVHGGGGTAFKEWVELWAKRGYAAIAMDLTGCTPDHKRLDDGGPPNGGRFTFADINEPLTNQWPYHAVADVILAHSLLRSFSEVDADRTAITGISWGGYLTCIVAGLDNRFKVAVPVYGCGFLYENSAWIGQLAEMTPASRERWIQLFDPSRYVGAATMPMFFVNGTNDFAYPLDSYVKTYNLIKRQPNLRITINMPHGHSPGWSPKEIQIFTDQYLKGGTPLLFIKNETLSNGQIRAAVIADSKLLNAQLNYTTDIGKINKRTWHKLEAELENGNVRTSLPANVTVWFLTVRDEREAIVSGQVHILQ